MVTHYLSPDGRRYRGGCSPYNFAVPEFRRPPHMPSHESRTVTMADPQTDSEQSQPRKRIPVACGRCRKRKIRCSGDPGHGQPCSNCKIAGVDECLFLRVSSQEWRYRGEATDFAYNLDAARVHAQRSATTTDAGVAPYTSHEIASAVVGDGLPPYRSSGANLYPYGGGKAYYSPVGVWNAGYADEAAVDYGNLGCPPYGVLAHEAASMIPYSSWSSSRKPSMVAGNGIYMDTADGSSYPYSTASTSMLHQRPSASSESQSFSVSSIAATLPSSSGDRLLPTPSTGSRTMSGSMASSYRGDSIASAYSKASVSSASSVAASPISPMTAETAVSSTYDGSGLPSSYATGSHKSHHRSSHASVADVYSNLASSNDALFSDHQRSIGSQGSAVDLGGYTYSGGNEPSALSSSGRRDSASEYARTVTAINGLTRLASSVQIHGHTGSGTYGPSDTSNAHHHHHHHTASAAVVGSATAAATSGYDADVAVVSGSTTSSGSSGSGSGSTAAAGGGGRGGAGAEGHHHHHHHQSSNAGRRH